MLVLLLYLLVVHDYILLSNGLTFLFCLLKDEELNKKIRSRLLEEERREESDNDDDDAGRTEYDRKQARLKRRRRRRTDEDLSEGW